MADWSLFAVSAIPLTFAVVLTVAGFGVVADVVVLVTAVADAVIAAAALDVAI